MSCNCGLYGTREKKNKERKILCIEIETTLMMDQVTRDSFFQEMRGGAPERLSSRVSFTNPLFTFFFSSCSSYPKEVGPAHLFAGYKTTFLQSTEAYTVEIVLHHSRISEASLSTHKEETRTSFQKSL